MVKKSNLAKMMTVESCVFKYLRVFFYVIEKNIVREDNLF